MAHTTCLVVLLVMLVAAAKTHFEEKVPRQSGLPDLFCACF